MELSELFLDHLRDIYYAERAATKALPKMLKAAQHEQLRDLFSQSKDEKPHHIDLLKGVFEAVGKRATGKTCDAMDGLISEVEELLEEAKEPSPVRDAGLIANAQAIAHYGIARYGTMIAWAKAAEIEDAVEPLEEMLEACKSADEHLSELANEVLNEEAADEEDEDEEEEEEEEKPAPAPSRKRK